MNWDLLILIPTVLFLLYYIQFVLSARSGLLGIGAPSLTTNRPSVSVLIAARNEQDNVAMCLRSVLDQDYPVESMEVILIDDGSIDGTSAIAEGFASRDSRLKILTLPDASENIASRKPAALAAGIQVAKGEIILTTDADCTVGTFWISSIIRSFDTDTAFVAGPVQELSSLSLISRISRLEFLGIIGTSAGLISNGTPIICNGANVAYRRASFFESGGFGDSAGFCDDEVIMHRIRSRNSGGIRCSIDKDSMVSTHAPSSLSDFWKQRIRWASKRGHYDNKSILLKLSGLYVSFLMLLVLFIASFFAPHLWPFVFVLFATKIVVDYAALRTSARLLHQKVEARYFLLAELLHVPYIVLAALAGQLSSLEWKGQRIRG